MKTQMHSPLRSTIEQYFAVVQASQTIPVRSTPPVCGTPRKARKVRTSQHATRQSSN